MPKRPRVILINPWIYDFAAANLWARPLGLLRVAEALSAFDLDLRFIDCCDVYTPGRHSRGHYPKAILPAPGPVAAMPRAYGRYGLSLEDFQDRLRSLLPAEAIFLTSVMTYWYPGVVEAVRQIRALAPGIPIVLGGIYPRLFPEHARAVSGADIIHTTALPDSLSGWLSTLGLPSDPVHPARPYYRLGLYDQPSYAPLLTSEGCPFRCAYCASPRLYPDFRQRPWREVFQEARDLAALGARDLAFYDDALLVNAERHLQPFLDEVIRHLPGLRFHTPNGLHARLLTRPLAERMHRAGFETIRLSLETVNPERSKESSDKVDLDSFAAAAEHLRRAGFTGSQVGAYLMIGLPGQMLEEIEAGMEYLRRLRVNIHLTEYSPLPGTPMWDHAVAAGLLPPDPDPLLTNNTVFFRLSGSPAGQAWKTLKDRVSQYNQANRN